MSKDFELLRKLGRWPGRSGGALQRKLTTHPSASRTVPGLNATSCSPGDEATQDAGWIKAFAVLCKRWKLVALVTSVVVTGAALVVFFMNAEYEPTARIEIDPPGSETFSMQNGAASPSETQYLETQAQNLQTDDLAIEVIRKLRLDLNPEFGKPTTGAELRSAEKSTLTPGENAALRTFRDRLKVIHDPNTHIILVSVMAHSPKLAADVTNVLAQAFVDRTLKMRRDAITSSRAWLEDQLNGVRAKVEQADRDLAAFQKQTGVAEIDAEHNSFGDMMTELNRQTTQAQSERIQLEAYLQKAREGGVDSLPQIRDNPVVQKLTQNLGEVRAQLSQDLIIYGINHPNTKKLKSQERELEKQLSTQRKEALDQLRVSYDAARARERLMAEQKREAGKTIADMAEYNILKKQAEAQSSLYNSLLSRIEEAGIGAASQSSNIRIVDTARVLDSPTRPHRQHNLAFALFVGILSGIVVAFVRERLDNPLRTPRDVRVWTGIPSVSVIPEFSDGNLGSSIKSWALRNESIERPQKFLVDRPHSPESEAVRGLQANVVLAQGQLLQSVLVASSLPGEGKTTVAVNLALALSHQGRTCLVDADLRRPCVADSCGVRNDRGLGDVLLGSVPLQDTLVSMDATPNLVVLPGGKASAERAHLVAGTAMQSVMLFLRSRFDFIVTDSAPILPYTEGRVLSTLTDGIIFVTRSGLTPGPAMVRSIELLDDVNSPPIIKVVLNAHTPPKHGLYYYPYLNH